MNIVVLNWYLNVDIIKQNGKMIRYTRIETSLVKIPKNKRETLSQMTHINNSDMRHINLYFYTVPKYWSQ